MDYSIEIPFLYFIERQINKSKPYGKLMHVGTAREQYFHPRFESIVYILCVLEQGVIIVCVPLEVCKC